MEDGADEMRDGPRIVRFQSLAMMPKVSVWRGEQATVLVDISMYGRIIDTETGHTTAIPVRWKSESQTIECVPSYTNTLLHVHSDSKVVVLVFQLGEVEMHAEV
jgi:hypothetical protein